MIIKDEQISQMKINHPDVEHQCSTSFVMRLKHRTSRDQRRGAIRDSGRPLRARKLSDVLSDGAGKDFSIGALPPRACWAEVKTIASGRDYRLATACVLL